MRHDTLDGGTRAEPAATETDRAVLAGHYCAVRGLTEYLCRPLEPEDYVVQSMPDASPAKWHLAHTTWFFETFLLTPHVTGYRPFRPDFNFLFNSYYNAVGPRLARPSRGLLSRPTVREVYDYRHVVDEQVLGMLDKVDGKSLSCAADVLVLGLHHEQQHQELLMTDLKHAFASNPLRPAYRPEVVAARKKADALRWATYPSGLRRIGHAGDGFAYDNETPRHRTFIAAFALASRLATCGEFLAFVEDAGYQRPELWLSDGWNVCAARGWEAPLFWEKTEGKWRLMTLGGMRDLDPNEPVSHVSYYEADAFARWAEARLPTEAEWETAAADEPVDGNLLDSDQLHPTAADGSRQLFGDVWEWTASPYVAYPGYRPLAGALGEYNGKFMCNQMVLRGGSCVTPAAHIRASYRNFFPPDARWQFSGLRLARDV